VVTLAKKNNGSYTLADGIGNKVKLFDTLAHATSGTPIATWPKAASATLYMRSYAIGTETPTLTFTHTADNIANSIDKFSVTVQDVIILFSKGDVRPGKSSPARNETVTATARRTGNTGPMTIALTSDNARATVAPASFIIPNGETTVQQVITVTGVTVSPANYDTHLVAKVGGVTKGSIPITVVYPRNWGSSAIGTPSVDTTPTATQEDGQWFAVWSRDITLTAQDQFGETLRSQWDGVIMQESEDGGDTWVGFKQPNGDALKDGQVEDPAKARAGPMTQAEAEAIQNGVVKISMAETTRDYIYRILEGETPFPLLMTNRRQMTLSLIHI